MTNLSPSQRTSIHALDIERGRYGRGYAWWNLMEISKFEDILDLLFAAALSKPEPCSRCDSITPPLGFQRLEDTH